MPLPTTIDEAYNTVNPDLPLLSGDPRYVDLGDMRGGPDFAKRLAQSLRRSDLGEGRQFRRQLLTGHRRCGKTTELFRLQHELERLRYFVVYVDVETELDLADISYLDVLLTIAKQIEKRLSEDDIHTNSELLGQLKDWFTEHIITRIETHDTERVLEAEYGLGLATPALIFAKMAATLTAHVKASAQRRDEIRKELERELSDFTNLLNLTNGASSQTELSDR